MLYAEDTHTIIAAAALASMQVFEEAPASCAEAAAFGAAPAWVVEVMAVQGKHPFALGPGRLPPIALSVPAKILSNESA